MPWPYKSRYREEKFYVTKYKWNENCVDSTKTYVDNQFKNMYTILHYCAAWRNELEQIYKR